jgi:hypothetical protein
MPSVPTAERPCRTIPRKNTSGIRTGLSKTGRADGRRQAAPRTSLAVRHAPTTSETGGDEPEKTAETIRGILLEQVNKLTEIKGMIFANPHIVNNAEWRAKAGCTALTFEWENEKVNGHAQALDEKEIEQMGGRYRYLIAIYGGYMHFAYAVASAYPSKNAAHAAYNMDRLGRVITLLREGEGSFGIPQILSLMPERRNLALYGADAFKIVYECIAHELGHICYGHVYGPGYDHSEAEANIGQEFDADSFAYAVIASSSFKDELWWGHIQFMIVQSALEILTGRSSSRTHPQTTDRLKTAIERSPDLATAHNVSVQWAEDMAIQLRKWLS